MGNTDSIPSTEGHVGAAMPLPQSILNIVPDAIKRIALQQAKTRNAQGDDADRENIAAYANMNVDSNNNARALIRPTPPPSICPVPPELLALVPACVERVGKREARLRRRQGQMLVSSQIKIPDSIASVIPDVVEKLSIPGQTVTDIKMKRLPGGLANIIPDTLRRLVAQKAIKQQFESVIVESSDAAISSALESFDSTVAVSLSQRPCSLQQIALEIEPQPTKETTSEISRFNVPMIYSSGSVASSSQLDEDTRSSLSRSRARRLEAAQVGCSELLPFLFISGAESAKSAKVFRMHNITRVINCAASVVSCHFEGAGRSPHVAKGGSYESIQYLSLRMLDGQQEDLSWQLWKAIAFIEDARVSNRVLLLHCEKGVSRSCAIAIAYVMWSQGTSLTRSTAIFLFINISTMTFFYYVIIRPHMASGI